MASLEVHTAVATTFFQRLLPLRIAIEFRRFTPWLGTDIAQIGRDLEDLLERNGDITLIRTEYLSNIAGELIAARTAADAGQTQGAWVAFKRAADCIDWVCADVAGELPS